MRRMFTLCVVLALSSAAVALTPNDFAEGFDVMPAGDSALQRVYLPGDVFRVAVRADLGDLRVFNHAGGEVASGLIMPAPRPVDAAWRSVPFFALPLAGAGPGQSADAQSPLTRVDVQLAAGGGVIAIHGATAGGAPAQSWLLDISAWRAPLHELELAWTGGGADALIELQVQASDDLATWQTVVARAALAKLHFGGHAVERNRVALPWVRARYLALRLLQAGGSTAVGASRPVAGAAETNTVLTGVLGRGAPTFDVPPIDERALDGTLVNGAVEYDTGGHYPIQGVTVWPVATNDAVEVRLLSRRDARAKWRVLGQAVAYRVMVGGGIGLSQPIAVSAGAPRLLRVEKVTGEFAFARDVEVRIRWPRPTLVFLRQGSAPFAVAFGAGGVDGVASPLPALLKTLGTTQLVDIAALPLARAGTLRVFGGAARLAVPRPPLPWQQIALWAALLVGVLVVGGMALRLLRANTNAGSRT